MADFEVVVLRYADKIKSFCEHFDQRLKHSEIQKVTKIGMSEWELRGGWFSKAKITIYPRRNDIICKFKTEIDKIALGDVVARTMAQSARSKLEREIKKAIENAKIIIFEEASTKPTSSIHVNEKGLLDCPGCRGALDRDMNFCPFCGLKLVKCIVCNYVIDEDQEIAKCSYCAGSAHRDHILEYVKVKGYCPSCGKRLIKEDLV